MYYYNAWEKNILSLSAVDVGVGDNVGVVWLEDGCSIGSLIPYSRNISRAEILEE